MARRSGRTSTSNSVHFQTPEHIVTLPQPTCLTKDRAVLRTQWKWAAFGQFITTFSPLLNIADITDIEDDLVSGSGKVIPRVMQRLLYTLSYDRKISLENWQSALRKQYVKRSPLSNPLGPEPPRERSLTESREVTPENQGDSRQMSSEALPNEFLPEATPQPRQSTTASEASRESTQDPEDKTQPVRDQTSVDWLNLPMLAKLESLHLVTEWQFQNPTRLRTLMRSDDELATWRHEPIGYDSKRNAFWLIGGDRLWVQRVPPKPSKSRKRKRPAENRKVIDRPSQKAKSSKRPRTKSSTAKAVDAPSRLDLGRAAKLQAKAKLDAQAKELAELNRQARGNRQSTRLSRSSKPALQPLGTRVSARLRGVQTNGWQLIPDEWLDEPSDTKLQTHPGDENQSLRELQQVFGNHDDSVSELTELSDDSDDPETGPEASSTRMEQVANVTAGDVGLSVEDEEVENQTVDSFTEWETICVTLEEWEHIAERFKNATHYLEKALYKSLTSDIVPDITQTLKEIEKKKRMEDALVHRKRSSRIAMRESEREEARLAVQRQVEEKEKMSRARRLEARRQREEDERARREQAREQRKKEREARELRRQTELEEHENQSTDHEPETEATATAHPPSSSYLRPKLSKASDSRQWPEHPANGASSKGTKSSDWELDCEICRKRGVNLDDAAPMMSCGKCFKWQHIACHDQADERAGRAKRNWDVVEFICQRCRSRMFASAEMSNPSPGGSRSLHRLPPGINPPSSYPITTAYQPYFAQGYGAPQSTPPSAMSTLYHAANGNYSHYTQPYGDARTPGMSDRYPVASQPYLSTHHYNQSSSISFSHYQPRGGGFSPSGKAQTPYYNEGYYQHPRTSQHTSYSDVRSSANQRPTATPPTQTVWNIATPTAGSYTTSYQSAPYNNGIPRRDTPLQPNIKPESSSQVDFSQAYPNTQFRYHSTT